MIDRPEDECQKYCRSMYVDSAWVIPEDIRLGSLILFGFSRRGSSFAYRPPVRRPIPSMG